MFIDNELWVCQIPDCTTTRAEIEFELKTFLSSYCTVCKQDRNGKLCGCAFPCSLTFRAHMLNKIHDLLGIEKPHNRKAIQVCFKHPDLLKQAREACVAKRRELCTAARARRFDRSMTSSGGGLTTTLPQVTTSPASNPPLNVTDAEEERSKMSFGSMMNVEENYRHPLDGPSTSAAAAQSQVSFGNPENDEVGDDDEADRDSEEDSEFEEFEDFARRKFAEIERKSKDSEMAKPSPIKMTKILFNLGNDTSEDDDDEFGGEMESDEVRSTENEEAPVVEFEDLENSRTDSPHRDQSLCSVSDDNDSAEKSDIATTEPTIPDKTGGQKRRNQKMFCIKYQNYHDSILMRELAALLHKSFLNDVQFVCRDGQVVSSSLLLGSMSPFLRDVLIDVPIVDKMKVVIVPDITTSDLETFLGFVFADQNKLINIGEKEARKIQIFAAIFGIDSISVAQKRRGRPRGSTKNRPPPRTSDPRPNSDGFEVLASKRSQPQTIDHTSDSDRFEVAASKQPRSPAFSHISDLTRADPRLNLDRFEVPIPRKRMRSNPELVDPPTSIIVEPNQLSSDDICSSTKTETSRSSNRVEPVLSPSFESGIVRNLKNPESSQILDQNQSFHNQGLK